MMIHRIPSNGRMRPAPFYCLLGILSRLCLFILLFGHYKMCFHSVNVQYVGFVAEVTLIQEKKYAESVSLRLACDLQLEHIEIFSIGRGLEYQLSARTPSCQIGSLMRYKS